MEKKNFVWNLVGATLNSFTSLFFMIIVTRINGIEDAGTFTFAFSIASLLQVIGTYHGRPFQVTNKSKKLSDYDFLWTRLFTCIVMFMITVIYVIVKQYDFIKSLIIVLLVIYRLIEAYADSYYAIMQKNDRLYNVGISLTIKSIISVFLFLVLDLISKNSLVSIIALIVSQLLIFLFYDVRIKNKLEYIKTKISFSKIKMIIISGFSIFIVTILSQYLLHAPKFPIDKFLTSDNQTIYGILSMPATMMLLCSQFIIHPFLLKMNNYVKDKKYADFKKLIYKLCGILLLLGMIGEIALYFIGIPILNLIYGVDLSKYVFELLIIVLGGLLFGISVIISYAMITMEKNTIQSIIFIIASIFAYLSSNYLVNIYSLFGASLSYLASMLLVLILYFIFFNHYTKKEIESCKKYQ